MKIPEKISLFWFRRDLRLHDNAGLYHALKSGYPVLCIFIFDTNILNALSDKHDARVTFIYQSVCALHKQLIQHRSSLLIKTGKPVQIFHELISEYNIAKVFTNHDYEPYAIKRDEEVQHLLASHGISFHTYKDHVIFEKNEVLSDNGSFYKVYTPYKKKWLASLTDFYLKEYPVNKYIHNLLVTSPYDIPSLEQIGFKASSVKFPPLTISQKIIKEYDHKRDIPSLDATSHLGIHFRFGTISIREKARKALSLNHTWLSELIWREFFIQLLYHVPHVVDRPFQSKFERISWRQDEAQFKRWCEGTTGYPLVDAGMRELNSTGYMHNRVRMVVASFLTKHLLIDWRWGEAYFAEKLLDFELASNNGNWQWCAGTGADAQPYFRIFNPVAQQKKFDPDFVYVKKWLPEYGTSAYPKPIVEHREAVMRAKEAFNVLK
ncbi:MAG: DNA photolyase family protein [Cytophagaceae bacterium]|nr:DNA photolyase family protein [Cytophagaceae bacterium]MDW8456834.1 deoxyribodipyrimidine photo-lyase [Cytophagaceae bacterium]